MPQGMAPGLSLSLASPNASIRSARPHIKTSRAIAMIHHLITRYHISAVVAAVFIFSCSAPPPVPETPENRGARRPGSTQQERCDHADSHDRVAPKLHVLRHSHLPVEKWRAHDAR